MTHLSEILDLDNLARHVEAHTVAEVHHPTEPVTLFNYTNRCQFDGAWDNESRACRGLIVDVHGEVLARPFPKFHNLYEHGPDSAAGPIELVPPLRVFDKLDGSLGIAYRRPSDGAIAWATRGSFTSAQAQWATAWWAEHHADVDLADDLTWLAEIIYPDNRIVLDYGDRAGLTLLAALSTETGHHVGPGWHGDTGAWPAEVVTVFDPAEDITQVDPNQRADCEGFVVLSGDRLTRVKLKADEYMRLHKILTGVSNVTIWDLLRNGDPLGVLYEKVPDEFGAWVKATVAELEGRYDALLTEATAVYNDHRHLLDDRKAFAAEVVQHDCRSIVFALADRKDSYRDLIWKQIKPERAMPFVIDADA